MKKKKFIKKCLSLGVSRNTANQYANRVAKNNGEYQKQYTSIKSTIGLSQDLQTTGFNLMRFGQGISLVIQMIKQFHNEIKTIDASNKLKKEDAYWV